MARVSYKVYDWTPKNGKGKCLMDIYYATEENKDTLCDIWQTHKKWGRKWYDLVTTRRYEDAIKALVNNKRADGFCFIVAVRCIEDLMHLEAQMEELDKGVQA